MIKNNFEWTKEKTKKIQQMLLDFCNGNELYSGESIAQTDKGNLCSPVVMSEIVDLMFEDINIDYK